MTNSKGTKSSTDSRALDLKNEVAKVIPVMERPKIAFILAIIAGLMNGYTFQASSVFSTVQSGNIILLGETIATQNWAHFYNILFTVLAFGLGSMFTALIEGISQRIHKEGKSSNWTFVVIAIEALVLVVLASGFFGQYLSVAVICMIISFVAGMQGNGFHKIKGMLYGNVAVTLVVQLAFNYLMQTIRGEKGSFAMAVMFFSVLLGFGFGGFVGTLATIKFSELSLLLPAILLILLMIYLFFVKADGKDPIDPTP